MADLCRQHSATYGGSRGRQVRARLDPQLRELPTNFTPEGKDKCAYCAYDLGYQEGYQAALLEMKRVVAEKLGKPRL